jgi:hypothetical protein
MEERRASMGRVWRMMDGEVGTITNAHFLNYNFLLISFFREDLLDGLDDFVEKNSEDEEVRVFECLLAMLFDSSLGTLSSHV